MRTYFRSVVVAIAAAVPAPVPAAGAQTLAQPDSSGYVAANGVNYWFEIRGRGGPLVLLHGGMMSSQSFGPVLTQLAASRRVISVDLLGHGRTALGERKIDPVEIGRDLGVVIERLGLGQADVMGYSLGGTIALQLAFQRPALVRRLILVSTPYAKNGWFAEMIPQQEALSAKLFEQMKGTPMYTTYAAIAPRPQDFPRLLDAMGDFMRASYDWSEQVKGLRMPVLLVYGDADMVDPRHMVEFYRLLGGGLRDAGWDRAGISRNRLAILPDLTHYEIGTSPALAITVDRFLGTPRH